ncbi:MraZ protein [Mariprofundus aestuarium]|uniref:Transcriptional regulator MraZ n=1 Tax=Mariprofundus aestuarium TaxID=1921086 RepID=A0A2K8KZ92_MARES|nr:division/cell wall cluster transcriptional repressor MraZ [Mariprofundus aestuarium]ATX78851.1 MraZ protein [Mariprofundus aestuarium]
MFQGEFSNNMDDKGRVSIPAAFRDALKSCHAEESIIITRTPHSRCLVAYPIREWKRLQTRINATPSSEALRAYKRIVISSAQEFSPDRQGRVLLSAALREYASLDRAVQFAGAGETFEIWDKGSWDRQLEADLALAQNFELGL